MVYYSTIAAAVPCGFIQAAPLQCPRQQLYYYGVMGCRIQQVAAALCTV